MADDARPVGPVIVRRRLGQELRRLREEADLRLDAVAAEMEMSPSKISRIETGQSPAKTWDVRNLLTLYGITDDERREEIVEWSKEAKQSAWWQADAADAPAHLDYFFSLEAEASAVMAYCTPVVPALLQTRSYARAHIAAMLPELSKTAIEKQVRVRLKRQGVLRRRQDAMRYTAVIDESALRRLVGTPDVQREQLEALLTLPRTVDLRVLPFEAGVFRAITSTFTIFVPRMTDVDPVVVNVESALSDTYTERSEDVTQYRSAFDLLFSSSLGPPESAAQIKALAKAV